MARARPVLLVALAIMALSTSDGPANAADAPPAAPAAPADTRTDVVLHPDAPIVVGRNVLWCATSQLAWDALADAIGRDGKLPLGPPAPFDCWMPRTTNDRCSADAGRSYVC